MSKRSVLCAMTLLAKESTQLHVSQLVSSPFDVIQMTFVRPVMLGWVVVSNGSTDVHYSDSSHIRHPSKLSIIEHETYSWHHPESGVIDF